MTPELLLNVEDLRVRFYTLRGVVHALERVSFHLNRQETLGLAGETGCGKSVTARAILRLIDPPGRICPLFQREYLRKEQPRWRKVVRFISDKQIDY